MALEKFYVLLNKPKGCITAVTDDRGRPTVMDYLPNVPIPVKPVGRLDFYTEGVLLLTNDGELAARLLAPNEPRSEDVSREGPRPRSRRTTSRSCARASSSRTASITQPAEVQLLPSESKHSWVAVTIHEGKHHQVHRMFEALGYRVDKLQRVAFSNLTFHHLRVGDARELTQQELNQLRDAVGLDHSAVARGRWRASARRRTSRVALVRRRASRLKKQRRWSVARFRPGLRRRRSMTPMMGRTSATATAAARSTNSATMSMMTRSRFARPPSRRRHLHVEPPERAADRVAATRAVPDRSRRRSAVATRVLQHRAGPIRVVRTRAAGVRAALVRAALVRAALVRAALVRAALARAALVRATMVRATDRVAEIRAVLDRAAEIRAVLDRAAEIRVALDRAAEIRAVPDRGALAVRMSALLVARVTTTHASTRPTRPAPAFAALIRAHRTRARLIRVLLARRQL